MNLISNILLILAGAFFAAMMAFFYIGVLTTIEQFSNAGVVSMLGAMISGVVGGLMRAK